MHDNRVFLFVVLVMFNEVSPVIHAKYEVPGSFNHSEIAIFHCYGEFSTKFGNVRIIAEINEN